MGEKSLVLENIALCEEIQKLRSLLNSRAEAYELLGQKVDMWRAAAERADTEAKSWQMEAEQHREALEELRRCPNVSHETVYMTADMALEGK